MKYSTAPSFINPTPPFGSGRICLKLGKFFGTLQLLTYGGLVMRTNTVSPMRNAGRMLLSSGTSQGLSLTSGYKFHGSGYHSTETARPKHRRNKNTLHQVVKNTSNKSTCLHWIFRQLFLQLEIYYLSKSINIFRIKSSLSVLIWKQSSHPMLVRWRYLKQVYDRKNYLWTRMAINQIMLCLIINTTCHEMVYAW